MRPFVAVLGVLMGVVVPAMAEVTTNASTAFYQEVFVPCANGGAGETVELSGELHTLVTATVNGNTLTWRIQTQPQGISGVGAVTGAKYRGSGITETQFSGQLGSQYEYTTVHDFRIVGQGAGNNLLTHTVVHVTVNANGEVTADVSIGGTECK